MQRNILIGFISLIVSGCGQPEVEISQKETDGSPSLEQISKGANFAGTNGIHFGPDGLLYVTSVFGSDLTVIDPESGERVYHFTAADGVIGPDDVAFASDGSYYWTSILTGEVAGFDPDGNKIIAAQLSPGVNPITFSQDDRLFVSQCFLGTNVYELDPKGVQPPRLIADDLGPGCGLNGMDWGPDDRLYGPRWFVGEVVSLDVETGERRVEATGFTTPAAVKFDSKGVLHVLDTGAGEIVRIVNGEKEIVVSLEKGLDNFAFDTNDRIFISSFTDGFIKRVEDDGTQTILQPGGLAHPAGIAVVGDTVWVADFHSIRGFNRLTGDALATQRNIVGMGEMGGAVNIAADGQNLILVSWLDNDVRVWNPNTEKRLEHYTGLSAPVAAVRYEDGIAISEHGSGSVKFYAGEDALVLADGLPAPGGLVSNEGKLYVSDRTLGQILRLERNSEPTVVVSGLNEPEGFVVVDDGFVVLEAEAGDLIHIDANGVKHQLGQVGPDSPGTRSSPPSQMFNGVAIDLEGNLFVSGETKRELYRLAAPW